MNATNTLESAIDMMVADGPEQESQPTADIDSAVDSMVEPEEKEEEVSEDAQDVEDVEDEVAEDTEESEDESPEETDEEAEDTDEESEETTTERYTVKVDGEDVEVTLDDLKRGYSGQQYVQKGMREAAEARKEAEAVYSQLQQDRQNVASLLAQIQENGITPLPPEPPKEMFQSDPIGYMEAKLKFDEAKAERDQQVEQLQGVAGQQSQAEQIAMQRYAQEQGRMLIASNPEWADEEKAPKLRERLHNGGQEFYGYSPEEISGVMDHRAILVLQDAIAYRELSSKSKKENVQKTVEKARVAKSNAKRRPSSSQRKAAQVKKRLKQSGSIDDAIGLIMDS